MPKVSCHSLYPASRALTPQHTSGAEVRSVLAPPPASWRRHTWICRGGATWRRIRRTHPVTPSPPTPPSPDLEGWGALPDSPALYPTPPRVQGCSRRGSVHPSLSSESFAKRGYCSKRKPLGPSTITGVNRPKPTVQTYASLTADNIPVFSGTRIFSPSGKQHILNTHTTFPTFSLTTATVSSITWFHVASFYLSSQQLTETHSVSHA